MGKKQNQITKPKVLVALTGQRYIFSRTAFCLIQMAALAKDYEFDFHMEMGCEIASSRNRMVQVARDRGCTHLLFVDYDMYFAPDTVSKLLKRDKDIIGATYNTRGDGSRPTAIPLTEASTTEPFKCETLGTGLLLIKVGVFDKLASPWFLFGYKEDGTLLYGEDTYFCQTAKNKASLDIWADPTLGVKHIGEQLF